MLYKSSKQDKESVLFAGRNEKDSQASCFNRKIFGKGGSLYKEESRMKINEIPQTDSIQELAHFWDTHDLTDFADQLEEVKEPVFERKKVLEIQLEPDDAEAIIQIARSRGVSYTELIKEWVLEKIHVK